MNIISDAITKRIEGEILNSPGNDNTVISKEVDLILAELYANIPGNKRISYGRYYTVKVLGKYLWDSMDGDSASKLALCLLENGSYLGIGVGLCLLSHYGLDEPGEVLPHFERYGTDDHWEVREFAASFIGSSRKNAKNHA